MKRIEKNIIVLLVLAAVLCLTACKKEAEAVPETTEAPTAEIEVKDNTFLVPGTITVAIHPNSTKYITKSEDGKVEGFEIDLIKLIAGMTLSEVRFVEMENRGVFADLDNSKYDLVISSVAISDSIDKVYDFSVPYLDAVDENGENIQYGIVVKTGNNRLLNVLNFAINTIKNDGRYDELCAKWFGEPEASSEESETN